ncbi:MAG TPA: alpha/beta hydrolase [Candidatus Limnocylindria bacterium]|nr:alpha/beta hydrolase [Candidatus Limnocylindria bacterium]
MPVLLVVLLPCAAVLLGAVWMARGSGKPRPFLDASGKPLAGSISEKVHVKVTGVEQGMFIRGRDAANPVLLFLHGGPGMPEYAVSRRYPDALEDDFVVCWWEQRGAGLSYRPGIPLETMTFEQLVADTIEVTRYLRKRFGQEKIYLMAHSGGTFTGIQAAARAPELYKAYVGVAQISFQLASEKLAYAYMAGQLEKAGDRKTLRKLHRYAVTELNTPSYYAMRDAPMHRLGVGTTRGMRSVVRGVVGPIMLCREYTLRERLNVLRGKFFTTRDANLWCKLVERDLTREVRGLDVPAYFIHGVHDYTVSYPLAREYFGMLRAPVKGFYTFLDSAHSPLFEEPERMRRILKTDVLAGRAALADAQDADADAPLPASGTPGEGVGEIRPIG